MAQFSIANELTKKYEGGYVFSHFDKGGETYKGIARNYHPKWKGWAIIDSIKKTIPANKLSTQLNKQLLNHLELNELVDSFYKINFWDKIKGDEIKSQRIANNIYDWAVNSGISIAVKKAQQILKIADDGLFGNMTLQHLNSVSEPSFMNQYYQKRVDFYNAIVKKNPTQQIFLKGWLLRASKAANLI